jgi:fatty-acyl-CoA synthase
MVTFSGPAPEDEPGVGALTLGGFLEEVVAKFGERPALLHTPPEGREVWSYSRLGGEARTVARALLASGVGRGSGVAVLMGARPAWVAAVFGAAMAGGVAVPINTFAEHRELDHLLRHSDTAVMLTEVRLLRHRFVDAILQLCAPPTADSSPGPACGSSTPGPASRSAPARRVRSLPRARP